MVGLSEAAVRQRVQRLIDGGVMQVVAVTDPMELGFARQAMVGVRVTGAIEPVADAIAELDEVDYVVVTAGSYDLLVEVVAESDEHLLEIISDQDPLDRRRAVDRDLHVPPPAQADLLVGSPLTYQGLSLWHETTPTDWTPRPPLEGDVEADVAIVGAGYTGLWTAYYLAEADPALRIVVLEAEVAGFGASGRNGGWCSALFPASLGEAQDAAMRASVDEVSAWPSPRASTATSPRAAPSSSHGTRPSSRGRAPSTATGCSPRPRRASCCAPRGPSARRTRPDCAAIHPGRLVRGLADVVTVAASPSTSGPRRSRSSRAWCAPAAASVRAPYVVRATEGYTPRLPGLARAVVPVYSLIVATEPLPPEVWDEIGLARRETFSDHRHLIIYGQRTADDRLVFGGRGAPYHLRSRISPAFDRDPRVFAALHATLLDLFPVLHRHPVHPRLGRAARHPARLVRLGRDWTAAPGSPGPAATSATASRPPTWPAGRSAT